MYNAAQKECLDVAEWNKNDGAAVRGWKCCCKGLPICGSCGDPTDNYNQAYDVDTSTTPPRVVTGHAMGGKCLVVTKGTVVTLTCSEALPGSWLVYVSTMTPPIRVAGNTSMCLASDNAPPPAPPPAPPSPPYPPVPQACAAGSNTTTLPFCNVSLPIDTRVTDLVGRMTLEEKLGQLIGGIGGGVTPSIPRLGVPPYQYHSEGLHGLRDTCGIGKGGTELYSTMFPQVTAMAATGNLSLIRAMASHMGDEARAVNNYLKGNTLGKGGGTYEQC